MRRPKLRELGEALRSFFSPPVTTDYPFTPYTPVPQYRGRPHYYEEDCVGCGACVQVCPAGALELHDDPTTGRRRFTIRYTHCIQCGQCEEKCLTARGIRLASEPIPPVFTREEERETIEKELVRCEACGQFFACRDHLRWLVKRLGPLAYGHPTLLLVREEEWQVLPAVGEKGEPRREDLFLLLCPSCRHRVVVRDVFS